MPDNPSQPPSGLQGLLNPGTLGADANSWAFIVQALINKVATATVVRVVAVASAGQVAPPLTVDVQPLVEQTDGQGNTTPHGVVYGLPICRLRGGGNAVILDPQVGDLGLAVFADHDVSSVKATAKSSPPGSFRRFDMADGVYVASLLTGTPTQYVRFYDGGIVIHSPLAVTVEAPQVLLDATGTLTLRSPHIVVQGEVAGEPYPGDLVAEWSLRGSFSAEGAVEAGAGTGSSASLNTHTHGGVTTGSGSTAAPNPGT